MAINSVIMMLLWKLQIIARFYLLGDLRKSEANNVKIGCNDGEFFENNYEIGKILKPIKGIIIPKDAVIRTGNKDIVYLYENGNFKKFEIEIITDVKDGYLVKNLKEGQIIVNKGVFLIDADAKLK